MLTPAAVYAFDERLSSLTVVMTFDDELLSGIDVAVCRVAEVVENKTGYGFAATEAFAGAGADFTILTTTQNILQVAKLNAYAIVNSIPRHIKTTDRKGEALFTDMPAGIYLVAQVNGENSEYIIAPYLVAVPAAVEPETGKWNYDITSYPKTDPTKKPSDEKIIISGYKAWHHHNRYTNEYVPENIRPRSITLIVLADGVAIIRKTISAADNWSWSIEVDKYADDGHEIVYTVDEAIIYNYRKWVQGYNIINEYSPGDNTEEFPDDEPPRTPPDEGPNIPYSPPPGPKTGGIGQIVRNGLSVVLFLAVIGVICGSVMVLLPIRKKKNGYFKG